MELRIEKNVPLAEYTTLHLGGVADYLVEVKSVAELKEALRFAKQYAVPPIILGGGSNVLVSDAGYRGLVIINKILGRQYKEESDSVTLISGAGENFDEVVSDSVSRGYWGLENLSAIPGTVGATPVQNVGAYGVEVSSLIKEVKAVHAETNEEKVFSNADCRFGYRDSFYKSEAGRKWFVTEVSFLLTQSPNPILEYGDLQDLKEKQELSPKEVRQKVVKIRSGKFPDWNKFGTAGSFFKNPIITDTQFNGLKQAYPGIPGYIMGEGKVKVSLGWILDHVCGLRGYSDHGITLYKKQALVLVIENITSATAVENFVLQVEKVVKEKTGIEIEREVQSV